MNSELGSYVILYTILVDHTQASGYDDVCEIYDGVICYCY